jgi:hypothetical protein
MFRNKNSYFFLIYYYLRYKFTDRNLANRIFLYVFLGFTYERKIDRESGLINKVILALADQAWWCGG